MGSNDGDEYERPQHKVTVKPFYIDLYEVTCEEYEKFVRATGHEPPRTWKNGQSRVLRYSLRVLSGKAEIAGRSERRRNDSE